MKKVYVLACLLLLLTLSSTTLAAFPCNPFTVAGSYVRQITPFDPSNPYIDQLTLGVDGTAHWFSSSSFDFILQGTFIPEIGSWTCLADGSVLVTTIGADYGNPSPSGDVPQLDQPLDININENRRFTQKLSLLDRDTLQPIARIVTHVPLSNDPLGPGSHVNGCSPSGTPCNASPYKRIHPLLTDIP